jgi:iron uptake system EfeUOB component EfeO/EfeM
MKRIVFTCFVLAATVSVALAQSASINPAATQEQRLSPKLLLSSKINQFHAYASRNNDAQAEKALNEAFTMMKKHIEENTQKLATVSDQATKGLMSGTIEKEKALYSDAKALASELMKNKDAIKGKLTAFMQTL